MVLAYESEVVKLKAILTEHISSAKKMICYKGHIEPIEEF